MAASPLEEWVISLTGGPWYTRSEIADRLGVTKHALLVLGDRRPELAGEHTRFQNQDVVIYDKPTYDALVRHFRDSRKARKGGRPSLWTPQEATERRRKYDQERYYLREQTRLRTVDADKARRAGVRAAELRSELDEQERARKAEREQHPADARVTSAG